MNQRINNRKYWYSWIIAVMLLASVSFAETITLINSDSTTPSSVTSFNGDPGNTHWSVPGAPSSGNDYVVGSDTTDRYMITPNVTATFEGDSLTVTGKDSWSGLYTSGGILQMKTNNVGTTVDNLILDHYGNLYFGGANAALYGHITLGSTGDYAARVFVYPGFTCYMVADVSGANSVSVNTAGTGVLTFTGALTYSGDTYLASSSGDGSQITLYSTSSILFDINQDSNNKIYGDTGVTSNHILRLNGSLLLDISDVTGETGSWTLVENSGITLDAIYGSTFSVGMNGGSAFTEDNNVWTLVDGTSTWTFTESTGILSLSTIPEPSTMLLLGVGGAWVGVMTKRKRFVG